MKRKTLREFETKHGGSRIAALEKQLDEAARKRQKITLEVPAPDNIITIAAIGDTHFASRFEAKDQLAAFYRRLRAEGVRTVLHAGDVLSGHRVYKGHEFEVHKVGLEEQLKWFAEMAPREPGITTHFITGNHDESFKALSGVNVGDAIHTVRPDWMYLGSIAAKITLKTPVGRQYRIMLLHPDGGSAYALSYRLQQTINALEGGNKPNMLLMGHYHKTAHLPQYRNIDGIQTGCFEWQTPFMERKGSPAHVGGWILRIHVGDAKALSNSVRAEFVSFYAAGEE
jgi:UDP-2,3-diacylglucosamine pyrophosphatase LpxH